MMWLMALREPESLKSAVTEVALLIVNWHDPVPEHGPDQPKKLEFDAGVATKVTADAENHTVTLENYTTQPVMLNEVTREN